MHWPRARADWIDACSALVLVLFGVWSITSEAIRTGGLGDVALDDYAIARDLGTQVVDRADYAWQLRGDAPAVVFAYPPPDALLHRALAEAGHVFGPVLFMGAVALSCWAGVLGSIRLLGGRRRPLRFAAALLAVAACRAFVQADLHLLNSNSLAVGLALASCWAIGASPGRRWREVAGGLLLATSIAVKPFAVGVVVLLAVLGRRTALAAALGGIFVGFVVVPALVLGSGPAYEMTRSWLLVLERTASLDAGDRIVVDNVSLGATLPLLGMGRDTAALVVRGGQLLWLGAVAGLLVGTLPRGRERAAWDARRWFLVSATVLAAPVPLSAIFQPHHAVALLPLALVAAFDVFDPSVPRRWRRARLGLLVAVFLASSYAPAGPARGFAYSLCPWILLLAAWLPGGGSQRRVNPAVPATGQPL